LRDDDVTEGPPRIVSSEVFVFIDWEIHAGGFLDLCVHGLDLSGIDSNLNRLENWSLNEGEVGVTK